MAAGSLPPDSTFQATMSNSGRAFHRSWAISASTRCLRFPPVAPAGERGPVQHRAGLTCRSRTRPAGSPGRGKPLASFALRLQPLTGHRLVAPVVPDCPGWPARQATPANKPTKKARAFPPPPGGYSLKPDGLTVEPGSFASNADQNSSHAHEHQGGGRWLWNNGSVRCPAKSIRISPAYYGARRAIPVKHIAIFTSSAVKSKLHTPDTWICEVAQKISRRDNATRQGNSRSIRNIPCSDRIARHSQAGVIADQGHCGWNRGCVIDQTVQDPLENAGSMGTSNPRPISRVIHDRKRNIISLHRCSRGRQSAEGNAQHRHQFDCQLLHADSSRKKTR